MIVNETNLFGYSLRLLGILETKFNLKMTKS